MRGVATYLFLLALLTACHFARPNEDLSVRGPTYRAFLQARELSDKGDYEKSLQRLSDLEPKIAHMPMERALLEQSRAQIHLAQGDNQAAIVSLRAAANSTYLPKQTRVELQYTLVQLLVSEDRFNEGITELKPWIENHDNPPASAYALAGHISLLLHEYSEAVQYLEAAVSSDVSEELWWQLLLAAHYKLEKYNDAVPVLKVLIAKRPEETKYWLDLANTHLLLQDETAALCAIEMVDELKLLSASEILRLANLHIRAGSPHRAAILLEAGLDRSQLDRTTAHMETLAQAWALSREFSKSSRVLIAAAQRDRKNQHRLQLLAAELLAHDQQWPQSIQTLQMIEIDKERDDNLVAKTALLHGVAALHVEDYKTSREHLQRAKSYPLTNDQATQWIGYINAIYPMEK